LEASVHPAVSATDSTNVAGRDSLVYAIGVSCLGVTQEGAMMAKQRRTITKQERRRIFQKLNLSDDFMFGEVMSDLELCRITLEKILGISIKKIVRLTVESTIRPRRSSKGVRLDVQVTDDKGNVYNIEMQTGNRADMRSLEIPKRSRYNHACLDVTLLKRGADYTALPQTFVIFICTFDLFGRGLHVYTFEKKCVEAPDLTLDDGIRTVFLNTRYTVDAGMSGEMKEFLGYIENSTDEYAENVKSDWVRKLHGRMVDIKENHRTEVMFMKSALRDRDMFEDGRYEGREEFILNMHEHGYPVQEIAKVARMTTDEVEAIINHHMMLV
jgi:predicted transposase/invertase (TIGR01784 family)